MLNAGASHSHQGAWYAVRNVKKRINCRSFTNGSQTDCKLFHVRTAVTGKAQSCCKLCGGGKQCRRRTNNLKTSSLRRLHTGWRQGRKTSLNRSRTTGTNYKSGPSSAKAWSGRSACSRTAAKPAHTTSRLRLQQQNTSTRSSSPLR